ncbi:uncharacterized protein NPIL_386591 [Nephila pilipes]|uniref:Uncharacterized protein n=1 Tax=Nephila pilipes TaxID=299642 RepID=A0A8X6NE44_NEPPI|nr:uncharacterized protein NPIL_386591 [Nephila pilipes]
MVALQSYTSNSPVSIEIKKQAVNTPVWMKASLRTNWMNNCQKSVRNFQTSPVERRISENANSIKVLETSTSLNLRSGEGIKDHIQRKQDERKMNYGHRRPKAFYKLGDKVWVRLHPVSNSQNKRSKKFMPKSKGRFLVITNCSLVMYGIADLANPDEVLET